MLVDWDVFEEYVSENIDDCYEVFTRIAVCEAKKYLTNHVTDNVDEAGFISDVVPRTTKAEVLVFIDPSFLSREEVALAAVTSQNIITSYDIGSRKENEELYKFFNNRHKDLLVRLKETVA